MRNLSGGLAVVLLLAGGATASAQEREHYHALAVNMSNVDLGSPTTVDIVIERWSTDEEEAKLVEAFQKGQDALLSALQKIKPRAGYIALPGETGWRVKYANKVAGEDGGWQIVLLTDRPMEFEEAANRPRSYYYPFTLVELHVDDDGVGQGQASVATKITWDAKNRVLELENFASEPVRLPKVQRLE